MLGGSRIARHRHRVAKEYLAHVEGEFRVGIEPFGQRFDPRAERIGIEVAAGVAVKLDMGQMGADAVEAAHRFQQRAPVAGQAEVGGVDVQGMWQPQRFNCPGETREHEATAERQPR